MAKASQSKALQGGFDRHVAIESDRPRPDCLGPIGRGPEKPIASLGLAPRLKPDFCNIEELQG
jgi:hypothetical protein